MALELAPNDREVELAYINSLDAGKRQPQAKWQAIRYQAKYPDHETDVIPFLSSRAANNLGENSTRVQSVFHPSHSPDEDDSSNSEEEGSHGDQDSDDDNLPTDDDGFWKGNLVTETDIKEAAFFGKNDAYIIAGSDDGRALVWDKATGELVNAIDADADIVNCVQPHPFDACIATSGIENVIRLWSPTSGNENTPTKAELEDILTRNQSQMDDVAESFGGAMHNMIRLVFQAGGENQAIQECATS
ncbi:hypothetical protein BBP00_00004237 [Phytophthora kernoviae]|uniref:Uncharacterized protein n=1 Tax=Phytophthora kernoviae TaxID=325452 RepID=A0A3F2RU53_9STRA|nr:hypothetical protein BBP00_00004237 [Phytophthora kernoviae]